MGFLDFASLLGGMAQEASTVRTERHQQENDAFLQAHSYLQDLINNPRTNEGVRQQAAQAAQDMIMEHLGYNKKSKQPNPIRKAVEGMVGQQTPNYAGAVSQIGVGSGNAKTPVGGAPGLAAGGPPSPPQAAGMTADTDPNVANTYSGLAGAPPPPPPQVTAPIATAPQDASGGGMFMTDEDMILNKAKADLKVKDMQWESIKKSAEYKKLPDQLKNELYFKHYGNALPQGSINTKFGDPLEIDQVAKTNPEFAADLTELKDAGVTHVKLEYPATGGSAIGVRAAKPPSTPRGASPSAMTVLDARKNVATGAIDPAMFIDKNGKAFDLSKLSDEVRLKKWEKGDKEFYEIDSTPTRNTTADGQNIVVPTTGSMPASPASLGAAAGTLPTTSTTDSNLATGATTTTRTTSIPAHAAIAPTSAPAIPRPPASPGGPPRPPAGIPAPAPTDTDQSEEAKLGRNWAYFGIAPAGLDTKGKTKVTKWMTDHDLNASQPVSPALRAKVEEGMHARNSAIDAVRDLQANSTTLSNVISAGKIELSVDGSDPTKLAVRLLAPLTDKEAQVAGDWQVLAEHINLLRGPLGATGFRSEKSWKALQDQRGNLLADPRITSNALSYTLKNLQNLNTADSLITHGGYNNPGQGGTNGPPPPPGRKFAVRKSDNHRIYTDDGQKTWHDAATGELIK